MPGSLRLRLAESCSWLGVFAGFFLACGSTGEVPGGPRPQPQQRLVERGDQPRSVVLEQRLDNRTANVVRDLNAGALATRERAQPVDEARALARPVADEQRRT